MTHQLIPIGQRFIKVKTGINEDDRRVGRDLCNETEHYRTFGAKARHHTDFTEGLVRRVHPREELLSGEPRQRVVLPVKIDRKVMICHWARLHRPLHTKLI